MSREIRREKEGNLRFTLPRTRFLAHAKTRCRKGKMVEGNGFLAIKTACYFFGFWVFAEKTLSPLPIKTADCYFFLPPILSPPPYRPPQPC
jgi:hypothetical protein